MTNRFAKLSLALIATLSLGQGLHAQSTTTLTRTTISTAINSQINYVTIASGTNFAVGYVGYLDREEVVFEPVGVLPPTTTGAVRVYIRRGAAGTRATSHVSGTPILIGPPSAFTVIDQAGGCTAVNTVTPTINVTNGRQWICSTVLLAWVPGFANYSAPLGVTTLVASAAGVVVPSGPLFHMNGTSAITGFTLPAGYTGGEICAIPDAAFTTTTAGNIAAATTAVVGQTLCWEYDVNASKPFSPSYK